MIQVSIEYWELIRMYQEDEELYDMFMGLPEKHFISFPNGNVKKVTEDGIKTLDGYNSASFYVNDFKSVNENLWKYCSFKPVAKLEMMGLDGTIKSKELLKAAQMNQIMLPNSILYEMKELRVEIDQCTDAINELLVEGWRLVAVLPQHQQRRPDYILGKL